MSYVWEYDPNAKKHSKPGIIWTGKSLKQHQMKGLLISIFGKSLYAGDDVDIEKELATLKEGEKK